MTRGMLLDAGCWILFHVTFLLRPVCCVFFSACSASGFFIIYGKKQGPERITALYSQLNDPNQYRSCAHKKS